MIFKASQIDEVEVIRTGLFIDRLVGIGGLPKKRLVEIAGEPGAGKSTLCMQIIAEAQKQGQRCLWVDVEASYVPRYGTALGIDNEALGMIQTETGEEALDSIEDAIKSKEWDLIVLDSIGALTPRSELEKRAGETVIGGQARLVAPFMRKIAPRLGPANVCFIVINHLKTDIMTGAVKAAGGAALEYHKALSIRLKKKFGVAIKQGENIIGSVVVAEVWKKNKLYGNVGMKLDVNFINNQGFSASSDLLQEAIERGIITKQGNTHFIGEIKLGMISRVREMLKDENFLEQLKTALG